MTLDGEVARSAQMRRVVDSPRRLLPTDIRPSHQIVSWRERSCDIELCVRVLQYGAQRDCAAAFENGTLFPSGCTRVRARHVPGPELNLQGTLAEACVEGVGGKLIAGVRVPGKTDTDR